MNTINLNAVVNSWLDAEIDKRRGQTLRSYFKRQSRRQLRHRLADDLHMNMGQYLSELIDTKSDMSLSIDGKKSSAAETKGVTFISSKQRSLQSVVVVRTFVRSPFERKHQTVELLAA